MQPVNADVFKDTFGVEPLSNQQMFLVTLESKMFTRISPSLKRLILKYELQNELHGQLIKVKYIYVYTV